MINIIEKSGKKTHEEFIEKMQQINQDIEILSQYNGVSSPVKCKCLICGYFFEQTPNQLMRKGRGKCPQKNKHGYPLLEKYPELLPFIKDKEEFKGVSLAENKNITLVCPICKKEKIIHTKYIGCFLKENKFSCENCKTGISLPNRFMKEILIELNNTIYKNNPINFILEYTPDFVITKDKKYRYDVFFNLNNQDYYIELDGEQHYGENGWGKQGKFEIIKNNDIIKDNLVKKNNGIIIRINCYKTTLDFMKNSILNSDLFKILDFSDFNWNEVYIRSQESLVARTWDLFKQEKSINEIQQELKLSKSTVLRYLRRGKKLKMFGNEVLEENNNRRHSVKVKNIKTDITYQFISISCFAKFLIINGLKYSKRKSLETYIKRHIEANKDMFDYKVSYLTEEEIEQNKLKLIRPKDLDKYILNTQ